MFFAHMVDTYVELLSCEKTAKSFLTRTEFPQKCFVYFYILAKSGMDLLEESVHSEIENLGIKKKIVIHQFEVTILSTITHYFS
jgi:hypothetical protein